MTTLEQHCRDLLWQAFTDGIIMPEKRLEEMTSGDLVGMSNCLAEIILQEVNLLYEGE